MCCAVVVAVAVVFDVFVLVALGVLVVLVVWSCRKTGGQALQVPRPESVGDAAQPGIS